LFATSALYQAGWEDEDRTVAVRLLVSLAGFHRYIATRGATTTRAEASSSHARAYGAAVAAPYPADAA